MTQDHGHPMTPAMALLELRAIIGDDHRLAVLEAEFNRLVNQDAKQAARLGLADRLADAIWTLNWHRTRPKTVSMTDGEWGEIANRAQAYRETRA